MTQPRSRRTDRGTILPIVLVVVVVLAMVIVAVADYASTTLRYGQVVERSADRLATVNGALDNALEAVDRRASPCTLTTLANAGYEFDLLSPTAAVSTINGLNPRIRCQSLGAAISGVEEYALVLTGAAGTGTRSGALLNVEGSITPRKVVDGPVFLAQPPNGTSVSLVAPLTIQNGDLWYGRSACPAPAAELTGVPLYPTGTGNLLITPAGYRIRCVVANSWATLFSSARPSEAVVAGLGTPAPAAPDSAGCKVFSPGRYTSPPALDAYNYFQSGDYYFENVTWDISNSYVLMGWPGPTGPGIPSKSNDTIADNVCVGAWEADAKTGATLYLGGTSRITMDANGALEVSGRSQSGRLVGVQALETAAVPSTIQGDAVELIKVTPGANRQISIEGLLWAPYGSMDFRNVSNDAVAALNGGAVVSEIFLQAPASATNFLVTSGSTAGERRLEFTATASSPSGGSTQARAIIRYFGGAYALESRRVMCLTPGDTSTTC
jgi:hypothetical protein